MSDRGPRPDGHFTTGGHIALANPADENSPPVETVIENFTSYKNRNGGMWVRGEMDTFKNLKLADNAIGYTHASGNLGRSGFTSRVVDSLFVGETENIGNPRTPAEIAYGRSLPEPAARGFPDPRLRVLRLPSYTGQRHLREFRGQRHPQDGSGLLPAVHQLRNEHQQHHPAREIHRTRSRCISRRWSISGATTITATGAYKTAVFHDVDGSVSGVPDSYVLNNDESDAIAIDDSCEIKPTWNAAVCKGDYGRLAVAAPGRRVLAVAPGEWPTRLSVEALPRDLLSRPSFSAAMARSSP